MNRHVIPKLHSIPIHLVTPKMLLDILKPLEVQGKHETVKRLCRLINEIMRMAVASGDLEINPLVDITKLFAAPKRNNRASKVARFNEKNINTALQLLTRCMIEWQLYTVTVAAAPHTKLSSELNNDAHRF